MAKALVRFYAELNDFLSADRRYVESTYSFEHQTSVKQMIEAFGVPHTDVDLILVNERSVDFSHILQNGERISVYPVFETLNIAPLIRLRSKPLRELRFVLDNHLGKLAGYLRLLGFDTLYQNDYGNGVLVEISVAEKRILLTRDRDLLKRKAITRGYCVEATNAEWQLIEIVARFDLAGLAKPFTRCLRCNDVLQPMAKEAIIERLPPKVSENYDEFYICSSCRRVYWKGSHYERMKEFVDRILSGVRKGGVPEANRASDSERGII